MKGDKKKMLVLGALLALMLAVGAFSFLGGSTPPPAPVVAKKTDGKTPANGEAPKVDEQGNPIEGAEGSEPPKNPLYVAALPQRDPFQTREVTGDRPMTPNPIVHQPAPVQSRPRGGQRFGGGEVPPVMPTPLEGNFPGGSQISVTPTGPDPSAFGYTLSGTMTGARSIAVFTDSSGNQRMVPVGGSLDGDSKVISIEKGSVTIEYRGKKQRISQGGNPK